MSSKQETIEDIVAEMRNESHAGDESCLEWIGAKMHTYADRIEAAHQREVAELRGERNGILNANASLADDNDRLRREVAELEREVAELRECLKEAIREKCPFTRMSCKHGEPCDYECGTEKWRKALKGSSND